MSRDSIVSFLVEDPARTGLFTDFDGTLAPIVPDPTAAAPLSGALEALRELSARLKVVGVVSGRPVSFLVSKLRLGEVPGAIEAYGLHGLEHSTGGVVERAEAALAWQKAIDHARELVLASMPPGAELEDKVFGFTLHWRSAADQPAVARAATEAVERAAARSGLALRRGKASIELVPPVGIDKGSVLLEWVDRLERSGTGGQARLVFFGDDVSDLLGFEVLGRVAAAGRARVLRVAVSSAEAPPRLLEESDDALAGPAQVRDTLVEAAERLRGETS